jgi:hypothetical protein
MAYPKVKLKSDGVKASVVSDDSEYEMHQANNYLSGLYYRFRLNTF